jgi:uncharacterized membrane-anchored protein YhcB (DUF1043 family)
MGTYYTYIPLLLLAIGCVIGVIITIADRKLRRSSGKLSTQQTQALITQVSSLAQRLGQLERQLSDVAVRTAKLDTK